MQLSLDPSRLSPVALLPALRVMLACLVTAACCVGEAEAMETAAEPPSRVRSFLDSHCADCHSGDAKDAEGGFSLEELDPNKPGNLDRWVRVWDRVHEGEMPPSDYARIRSRESQPFLEMAEDWLKAEQLAVAAERGRVQERRLTSIQLERTLHDLLGIDVPLARMLPEDRRTDGFTTVADGQSLSHFDLQNHLNVVDEALDEAFDRAMSQDKVWTKKMSARDLVTRRPNQRTRSPEWWEEAAVIWSSRLVFYGRIDATRARVPGWYRFAVDVSSLKQPEYGVWSTIRTGYASSSAPTMTEIATFNANKSKKTITVEAWLDPGQVFEVRPHDRRLKMGKTPGGQVGAGEMQPQNVPGIAMHGAVLEKFHKGPDRDGIRDLLFDGFKFRWNKDKKQNEVYASDVPAALRKSVRQFARRAFRRPLGDDALQPYLDVVDEWHAAGESPITALRETYRTILCSPRFLYHVESPGTLDAHAVANRLSYFLTGSMPDEELTALADSGRILDDNVLREQTRRLMAGDNLDTFVRDFAREWLDLSEIDFTEVDPKLYPGFDLIVQNSMLAETHSYLKRLFRDNRPASYIADSTFMHMNERLADHYGYKGDLRGKVVSENAELKSVSIGSKAPYGGLMTQGSIMKVTANGTATSPVLRGVWIAERLLGLHIPPPPANVPAVEPDIRGATTIREQLDKHRSDPSCNSCHRKIDPTGFALESFDPAGRFRQNYQQLKKRKLVVGPKIDPGDRLPEALEIRGGRFENIVEMAGILETNPEPLARSLVMHLLTYGTGGKPGFADRGSLEAIVSRSADTDYGFMTLLEEAVLSDIFRTK